MVKLFHVRPCLTISFFSPFQEILPLNDIFVNDKLAEYSSYTGLYYSPPPLNLTLYNNTVTTEMAALI